MQNRIQSLRTPHTPSGEARRRANLSLRQLEELTGISRGLLSMWERGRYLLTPEQVQRISEVLRKEERS